MAPIKHGHAVKRGRIKATRAYACWLNLKNRCLNKSYSRYAEWGGRGINVCPRWIDSFESFLADMGEPPPGTSIDRIDNDGDYCKENCQWATRKQQSNNRRHCVMLTFNGRTMNATQWGEELGLDSETIISRLKKGWTHEAALTKKPCSLWEYQGRSQSVSAWSKELGIKMATLYARIKYGWSIEKALSTPLENVCR